jgi:hypothetical protein
MSVEMSFMVDLQEVDASRWTRRRCKARAGEGRKTTSLNFY